MTREKFQIFFNDWIVKAEGGYVNHPKDPGRETKYGISKRSYPDLNIKALSKKQAAEIYWNDYWLKKDIDWFCNCYGNAKIALIVCDMCINHGARNAFKVLQRAMNNAISLNNGKKLKVDGKFWSKSKKAYQDLNMDLVDETLFERLQFYLRLKNFDVFGRGWLKHRVIGIREYINQL